MTHLQELEDVLKFNERQRRILQLDLDAVSARILRIDGEIAKEKMSEFDIDL